MVVELLSKPEKYVLVKSTDGIDGLVCKYTKTDTPSRPGDDSGIGIFILHPTGQWFGTYITKR